MAAAVRWCRRRSAEHCSASSFVIESRRTMFCAPHEQPPQSKREYLRRLVAGKQQWSEPVRPTIKPTVSAAGMNVDICRIATSRGWPNSLHFGCGIRCPLPGAVNGNICSPYTRGAMLRAPLGDAVAGAQNIASREQRIKLEEYLDRGLGECFLRDPRIAALVERRFAPHHGQRFRCWLGW